jgi:hypothetical protein
MVKNRKQDIAAKKTFKIEDAFLYENGFYLTCTPYRIAKALAHYELFKMSLDVPGDIVECGVFLGASLMRFIKYRDIFTNPTSRRVVAFDTFGKFPKTDSRQDKRTIQTFLDKYGSCSISVEEMNGHLESLNLNNGVALVRGDMVRTIPKYLKEHPDLKISLLNIDVDFYEPTKAALEHLYEHVSPRGVIILDDYGSFHGANKAIDAFLGKTGLRIRKLPFAGTPCYVVKEPAIRRRKGR